MSVHIRRPGVHYRTRALTNRLSCDRLIYVFHRVKLLLQYYLLMNVILGKTWSMEWKSDKLLQDYNTIISAILFLQTGSEVEALT